MSLLSIEFGTLKKVCAKLLFPTIPTSLRKKKNFKGFFYFLGCGNVENSSCSFAKVKGSIFIYLDSFYEFIF